MPEHASYKVLGIEKRNTINRVGRVEPQYEITFQTPSGVIDMLWVPEEDYLGNKWQAEAQKRAELHERAMTGA